MGNTLKPHPFSGLIRSAKEQIDLLSDRCVAAKLEVMDAYGQRYTKEAPRWTRLRFEMRTLFGRYIEGPHKNVLRAKQVKTQQDLHNLCTDALD